MKKLQQMVAKGKIVPEYMISEDKALWVRASEIKELFPELANIADDVSDVPEKGNVPAPSVTISEPEKEDKPLSLVRDNLPNEGEAVPGRDKVGAAKDVALNNLLGGIEEESDEALLLSVLWNPVYALPVLMRQYSDARLKGNSFILAFFAFVCFSATLMITLDTGGDIITVIKFLLIALLPFLLLTGFMAVFVKLFLRSEGRDEPVLSRTLFISGVALIPLSLSSLFAALLYMTELFSAVQMIVILCGLGVYSFSYAVLLLFNGFTKIFGVNGGGTVFLTASLLLLSSGITAFFIRLIQY